MTTPIPVPSLPVGTIATAGDTLVYVRGGVTKQIDVDKLPISAAVAAALAVIQAQLATNAGAPVLKAPPTITGTHAIGNTLTALLASGSNVTEGASGTHTNLCQWFGTPSGGAAVALGAAFSLGVGVTSTNLALVYPTHLGLQISFKQTPVDSAGAAGDPLTSLLTGAVTNTPPTYAGGVAPVISPSGSQAPNVVVTCGTGTLLGGNGSATFSYQWQYKPSGGTFSDIPLATSAAFTIQAGQSGGQLDCRVTPLTPQGYGTPGTSSNVITVTGTPTIVSTVAPTFATTLTQFSADAINVGTYTGGTIDPTCVYLIYCQEGPGGLTTPMLTYGVLPNGSATYTPPDNATFLALTGLASPVGKHFALKMRATIGGAGPFDSLQSTPVICNAASVSLQLSVLIPSLSLTMGQAFGPVAPVGIAQGVGPNYSWAVISGALPPGMVFNSVPPSAGQFLGTPAVTGTTQTTYQVTVQVTDGGNGNVATATFQVVISPVPVAGMNWLSFVTADQTPAKWATMNISLQGLGGDTWLDQLYTSGTMGSMSGTWVPGTGITYTGTVTGPTGVGTSTLRFGVITNPYNTSQKLFYMAAKATDPTTFGHPGRMELVPGGGNGGQNVGALAKSGTTYICAMEMVLPSVQWSNGGAGTIMQIHNSYPTSVATGPWAFCGPENDIFPSKGVMCFRIYQPLNNGGAGGGFQYPATPPSGGGYNLTYPFTSDNNGWSAGVPTDGIAQSWGTLYPGGSASAWPRDQMFKLIVKYRGDPIGSGSGSGLGAGAGLLQAWIICGGTTTQIVNQTNVAIGTNDGPAGYAWDYIKAGLDCLGMTGDLWLGLRCMGLAIDQGFTPQQIAADMDSRLA